jgi:hypothetical protein
MGFYLTFFWVVSTATPKTIPRANQSPKLSVKRPTMIPKHSPAPIQYPFFMLQRK